MPARGDEAQQIGGGHRGRAIVRQRVVVERVVLEHGGIEHRTNAPCDIVDERKGRDTPGAHPEELAKIVSAGEREAWRPEPTRELFQVGAALFEHDREPEPALPVLEEEALAVPSRQAAAQGRRLGNSEDGRMRIGPMRDPDRIEAGEELFRGERRAMTATRCGPPAANARLAKPASRSNIRGAAYRPAAADAGVAQG